MGTNEELSALQAEWRLGVTKKLDDLSSKLDTFPQIFASQAKLNELEKDIKKLQDFRNKSLGGIILLQFVLSLAVYFIKR